MRERSQGCTKQGEDALHHVMKVSVCLFHSGFLLWELSILSWKAGNLALAPMRPADEASGFLCKKKPFPCFPSCRRAGAVGMGCAAAQPVCWKGTWLRVTSSLLMQHCDGPVDCACLW